MSNETFVGTPQAWVFHASLFVVDDYIFRGHQIMCLVDAMSQALNMIKQRRHCYWACHIGI